MREGCAPAWVSVTFHPVEYFSIESLRVRKRSNAEHYKMDFPIIGALKMPRPMHDTQENIFGIMQFDRGAK
jgi:hypothetical protein